MSARALPTVLFVADTASQVLPAQRMARAIARELASETAGFLLPSGHGFSAEQEREAELERPIERLSLAQLLSEPSLLAADAVVAFLPGSKLQRLLGGLHARVHRERPLRRPVVVTGYNGLVYEKHLEGLLWRVGADVLCVNSRQDRALFEHYAAALGVSAGPLVVSGPVLAQTDASFTPPVPRQPRCLLFSTQAVVPRSMAERMHLLEGLRRYAAAHPDRRVLVKPRARPGERTFHAEHLHYEDLDRELGKRPANLEFAYGPLSAFLPSVDLLLTVSSSAAVEALASGVPAAILTDVGVGESLGNHFFAASGLFTSLPRLMVDELPSVNPAWLAEVGLEPGATLQNAAERVRSLLEQQRQSGLLDCPAPYYDATSAPFLAASSTGASESFVARARRLRIGMRELLREPRRLAARFR